MLILRPPWDSQPQEAARVDHSNSLARGMQFALAGLSEAVMGSGPVSIGPTSTVLATPHGVGWSSGTTAGSGALFPYSAPAIGTGPFTIAYLANVQSAGTFGHHVSVGGVSIVLSASQWAVGVPGTRIITDTTTTASQNVGLRVAVRRSNAVNDTFLYYEGRQTTVGTMSNSLGSSTTAGPFYTLSNSAVVHFPLLLFWGRALSEVEIAALAANPWQLFEPRRVYIPLSIASGAYTLNLETGVYSFTGSAATLTKDSKLTLDSDTYALSGSNASLLKGLLFEVSNGSYSLSGSDASLFYTHLLNASSGSYSVTGSDATLTYTPTTGAYTLNLESGAYVLLGQDVTFVYSGSEVTLKAGSWIRYRIIT